jgi:hypothetical protein
MTSEVKIHVESQEDVLTVPVQAVVERSGTFYCARRRESGWEVCEVKTDASNDKFVVIAEGLDEGDAVMLDLREHADEVGVPDADSENGSRQSRRQSGTTLRVVSM